MNAILKEHVYDVSFDANPILEKDLFDEKLGILDIRAKINNDIDCDIEMQVANQHNIEKRILFYLSKMYVQNIEKGKDYKNLNKCIAIVFTDFDIDNLKDIPSYLTKWNLREEKYTEFILTDAIELYIINLSKAKKFTNNSSLDNWIKFIINSGDVDMENSNDLALKKAKQVLEEISQDERERYLADLRQKYILDQKNFIQTGYEDGIEKGIEQGSLKQKLEIAKKLKDENIDIDIIIRTTNLTKEEIEKL